MCPRTCALGLSSSLLSENKKKTTKVCEIGDRESYFGALFILWIHGKNSHIRTTCKLGGHDLHVKVYFFFLRWAREMHFKVMLVHNNFITKEKKGAG